MDTNLVEDSASALAAEEFKKVFYPPIQGVSCPASEDIISKWIAGSWPVDRNELSTVSPSDDQEMYYGPMRLYYDSKGVLHLEIDKVGNNLSEVSPSDGQETKNFNPVLFEGSPSGSQEKKLDSVLPFEGGQESSITDGKESKKFSTNLSEVSPFDRQETKDFNPNLLESSSAAEPTDSSSVPVDDREAKKLDMIRLLYESSTIITEAIWDDDDDDNLVDEELLKEYLEKLDAKDRTRKIVKVDVDLCLREVKSYHSLTPSKKLDWITLQVIHRCYDSFCTNWTSQPLPLSEESSLPDWKIEELDDGKSDYEDSDEDYENSDEDVSHHEDCILDLNNLFPEDSDQDDSDHEDSELKKVESEEEEAQFKIMESQKAAQLESWKKVDQIKLMEFSKKTKEAVKSYQIKMESEKKKKLLTFVALHGQHVELDSICGIESSFIRMKLKNECYGCLLLIPIRCNTLQMVLRYCKKRAKIKLQHSPYDGDDDDDDEDDEDFAAQQKKKLKIFNSKFLQYDDEDLTAQQKKQLKKFDSKFLQSIYQCPDYHLPLDILDAAVSLHIKSLYDLVIDDVAAICERLSSKQILKIFKVGRHHYQEKFCSLRWFSWAFNINRSRNVDN